MIVYPVSQMLHDLDTIYTQIPNVWEQKFIVDCRERKARDYTIAQYNKLLDLYNKYIVVPAGAMQTLRNCNYHE